MPKNKKSKEPEVEIYNKEQRFWANTKENATASIEAYEKGIKLAKGTIELCDRKIEEEAE